MPGVPLDLRGPALVALHDHAVGLAAERDRGGVAAGDAGHDVLGRVHVGDDRLHRLAAAGQAGDTPRPPELEHRPPRDPSGGSEAPGRNSRSVNPDRGARFASRPLAHRWHPEQSVGGAMRRSAIVCAAHCAWFLGGVHCMFVTSAGGRRFGAGVPVAVQAPAHAERRGQRHHLHLVDPAVAGDAGHPGADVGAVLEVGVVGELVHRTQRMGRPEVALSRIGSRRALSRSRWRGSSCTPWWGGRWRPGRPRRTHGSSGSRGPAHRRGLWLYGTGCLGRYPTSVYQGEP